MRLEEIKFLYEIILSFNGYKYSNSTYEVSKKMSKNIEKELNEVPKHILYLILHNKYFKTEDMDSLLAIINTTFSEENDENEEYDIMSFY